jgi:hypothetical protein
MYLGGIYYESPGNMLSKTLKSNLTFPARVSSKAETALMIPLVLL